MEAVLSLSMKLLLLFYQIRYSKQTIVIVLDFRSAKQQMDFSMGEQPVSSKTFIAVFQIMQKSKIRVSRQKDFTWST